MADNKQSISLAALAINTLKKLSPYSKPWAIPAPNAYIFLATAAYCTPNTSLLILVLIYSVAKKEAICSVCFVSRPEKVK